MKTDIPSRTAVPFPPIRQVLRCPIGQQEPRREPKKKVLPAAPQPPPNFSHSWPKAGFQLGGRRPQPRLLGPRLPGNSCASAPASIAGVPARKSSGHSPRTSRADSGQEERFSLSLTPEAVLVIQKRSLERQRLEQPQSTGRPRGKAPLRCPAAPPLPASSDVGSLLKISLLNDQHKYDDVEYEEEGEGGGPPDRSVLQKCLEWLQGVESARGPAGRLARLPQLAS